MSINVAKIGLFIMILSGSSFADSAPRQEIVSTLAYARSEIPNQADKLLALKDLAANCSQVGGRLQNGSFKILFRDGGATSAFPFYCAAICNF